MSTTFICEEMTIFICDICNKQCSNKKSLASHKNFHNPEFKKKKQLDAIKGSNKSNNIRKEEALNKRHILENDYRKNPKFCSVCNNILGYEQRNNLTCSFSCRATFSNKKRIDSGWELSQESRNKLSVSIKKHIEKGLINTKGVNNTKYKDGKYISKDRNCISCGKTFFGKRKTCSNECLKNTNTINNSYAGKVSASTRTTRSKDEIKLFQLCENVFENCFSNHIISDGWDADIVLSSHKVAVLWNGPWHYKEMNMTNHSLKQVQNRDKIKIQLFVKLGWKVIVYEDRYFTPEEAFEDLVRRVRFERTSTHL